MKEHVVVFDNPPKFGKEIPTFYEIRIFDVCGDNKERIITLLKKLGFSSIKEERRYASLDEQLDTVIADTGGCILAKYCVKGLKSGYDEFWQKKELIEITLDCLLPDNAN